MLTIDNNIIKTFKYLLVKVTQTDTIAFLSKDILKKEVIWDQHEK